MYHTIVGWKLRQAFEALNRGDDDAVLPVFADRFHHQLHGAHALGGERHTLGITREWYLRLRRLMPVLRFDVLSVVVGGWPWSTTAFVSWRDGGSMADGQPFANQGVHAFRLRWGRVVSMEVHCDTQKLAGFCQRAASNGIVEASAVPLEEPLPTSASAL